MIEADSSQGLAHQGLAFVQLRMRRWEEAAASALSAIGCQFHLPLSHYYLGCALVRLGIQDRAIQAFEVALAQQPPVWQAHRWLALLLAQMPGRDAEADTHREAVSRALERRAASGEEQRLRREVWLERFRGQPPAKPALAASSIRTPKKKAAIAKRAPRLAKKSNPSAAESEALDLLLVSGLPRSGTSLMMQLLAAGGWPLLSDETRPPDEDNPEGYQEWEAAKQLRNDPELIRHAKGKVLKAVSLLLPSLPPRHHYRIIFMMRSVEQIAESQARMIARRKGMAHPGKIDCGPITTRLRQHLDWTRQYLREARNMDVLEVDYPALVENPRPWLPKIAAFAGRPELLSAKLADMLKAIRPELHRHRA
jgi:LPS sulfotransferase NodH